LQITTKKVKVTKTPFKYGGGGLFSTKN